MEGFHLKVDPTTNGETLILNNTIRLYLMELQKDFLLANAAIKHYVVTTVETPYSEWATLQSLNPTVYKEIHALQMQASTQYYKWYTVTILNTKPPRPPFKLNSTYQYVSVLMFVDLQHVASTMDLSGTQWHTPSVGPSNIVKFSDSAASTVIPLPPANLHGATMTAPPLTSNDAVEEIRKARTPMDKVVVTRSDVPFYIQVLCLKHTLAFESSSVTEHNDALHPRF